MVTPLYSAIGLNTTEESVHIQQYNFIKRAQNNKYVKEFMFQSRLKQFNDGLLGSIINRLGLKQDCRLEEINQAIETDLSKINQRKTDRHLYNA